MEIPSHSLSMTVPGSVNLPVVGYTVAQMKNNWTTKATATTTMQSLQSTYADQSDMGGNLSKQANITSLQVLDDRNSSTLLDLSKQFPKANTQVSKITVSLLRKTTSV